MLSLAVVWQSRKRGAREMYKCAGCPNDIKATELHGVKGNKHYCLECLRRIARDYRERTWIALLKI